MPRINSRIAKLERQASPEPVDCDSMLVTLLGHRDGLMWPWRTQNDTNNKLLLSARGAIRKRQVDYLDGKLGFSARAHGKDSWKDAFEQRNQLIADGLATAIRSGGEVTALRLTPQGEADARALVGPRLKTLRDIEVLRILDRCIKRQSEMSQWLGVLRGPARYMVEWLVLGYTEPFYGNPADWEDLTELTLPLLTDGYLQASSDSHGRLYYSLVYNAEGNALAELLLRDKGIPLPPISQRTSDPKFDDIYMNAFAAEQMALEQLESHDLVIPIPVSGSWMEWQTRAVRMRNAIQYPSAMGDKSSDSSKKLAKETLADDKATSEERELAIKLLRSIDEQISNYNRKRQEFEAKQAVEATDG